MFLALPIILSATEYIKFFLMPGKFVRDSVPERFWPIHVEIAPLFSRMFFDRKDIWLSLGAEAGEPCITSHLKVSHLKERMFIMKNLILMSIMGGYALTAAAQMAPDNQTVQITGPTPRIEAPSHYHRMRADEAYDYLRSYNLSNGMTLDLFYRGQQLYAEVTGQGRHAIVATAAHDFVSLDQQLKMTINLHGSDDATGELIMVVPQHQLANGDVAGERLLRFAIR